MTASAALAPVIGCPSCGAGTWRPFYQVGHIPVHSVLLMSTRERARSYRRGDLALAFCEACGFIWNTRFDPTVHEYSTRYEETQAFSETFNRFARDLAASLVEKYDLRGKRILEIGCGKGEFLVLLCELGGNTGVGIDPGIIPQRIESEAKDRITFINDFYSEAYGDLQADFVCCRHTLEHLHQTREFLRLLRRSLGERRETIVFFELPDVERVLHEQAFWDVYYEHCSYFSLGSLARLFRECGFEILDLSKVFDGQYLLIDARIAGNGGGRHFPEENDLPSLREAVERFERECPIRIAEWRGRLQAWHDEGKRVVLWGSGSKAVAFLTTVGIGGEIEGVVDINPHRHGHYMPGTGHPIWPPTVLAEHRPDVVIAMNPVYREEIRRDLEAMGLAPELLTV